MIDSIVFEVSQLHMPSVYAPLIIENSVPQYGATVAFEDAPQAMRDWLDEPKWVRPVDGPAYRLFGRQPPSVIADRDISTILSCTDTANLRRDLLLSKIPVLVRVDLYKMSGGIGSIGGRVPSRNRAAITAIKVQYADLLRRYDEICAEFFADPSLPWRGAGR